MSSTEMDEPPQALRLGDEFPHPTIDEWRAAVDKVIGRGAAELTSDQLDKRYETELVTTTVDGLVIQPLFTDRGAAPANGLPGFAPFVRGTAPLGRRDGWDVRQRVLAGPDVDRVAGQVLEELQRGSTSLLLDLRQLDVVDARYLEAVLTGVHLELAPISLWAGRHGADAANAMLEIWTRRAELLEVSGVLGLDPIGRWAEHAASDLQTGLDEATEFARRCVEQLPGVRAIVVDGSLIHESGGGDVEELGFAAASGIHYLRQLVDAGLTLDQAARQLEFRYAATPDQFLTIAKLRAARRVWQRITQVAGASTAGQAQQQHVVSSTAAASRYDASVNLLRNTVECFGAGVGGADSVTVLPHDDLIVPGGTELGRRMARNTQIVLIEESNLARVVDMAGGSWYVDQLTDQLATAAWSFMQAIEAAGSVGEAVESGVIQSRVDEVSARRESAIRRRKIPLTGVTEFPDISESVPAAATESERIGVTGSTFAPLRRSRYADPVEEQRSRADRAATEAGRPTVFLAALGPPSAHTARATFARNLFEVGGIRAIVSNGHTDPDQIVREFTASGAALVCICSSDALYEELAVPVASALAAAEPARVYLAGRPKGMDETLAAAGVHEHIVAGGDVVDVITRALDTIGVP